MRDADLGPAIEELRTLALRGLRSRHHFRWSCEGDGAERRRKAVHIRSLIAAIRAALDVARAFRLDTSTDLDALYNGKFPHEGSGKGVGDAVEKVAAVVAERDAYKADAERLASAMSDCDLGPAIADMERRIAEVYGLRREWALGRPRGETRAHIASLVAAIRVLRRKQNTPLRIEPEEDLHAEQDTCSVWMTRARSYKAHVKRLRATSRLVRIALSSGRLDDADDMLIEMAEETGDE